MVATSLALLVVVPTQLAAAAGLELSGGYDSTVLDPNGYFGDGGLARMAADLQLAHRTETLRQILRTRGEYYYNGGEGKAFDEGDFISLTRYGLLWEPNDNWQIGVEGSYAIGQSSVAFGRVSASDFAFRPGVSGEYAGALDIRRALGDTWRLSLVGGVNGRHSVSLPPGVARANMVDTFGVLEASHDFSEKNVGLLSVRAETFLVDGFADWVPRFMGYLGIRRNWSDYTTTQLYAGLDSLQDQNDSTNFLVGPYFSAAFTHLVPSANLAIGLNARYEYAIVAASRCAVRVASGAMCPASQVVSGGTGRVLGGDLGLLWRPGDGNLAFSGTVSADYGVTQNVDTRPGAAPGALRDVENVNMSAVAGVRWSANRNVSIFGQYNFLYTFLDARVPQSITDIYRHVLLAGVTVAFATGDGVTEPLVPYEELEALDNARSARGEGDSQGGAPSSPSDGPDLLADPFDLSAPDPADAPASTPNLGPGVTMDPLTGNPIDRRNRPPPPRNATQTLTNPGRHNSTLPSTTTDEPPNPGNEPEGGGDSSDSQGSQGESSR